MPSYGPTKFLNASKAVSKMAHIKYHTNSMQGFDLLDCDGRNAKVKIRQDPDARRSMT